MIRAGLLFLAVVLAGCQPKPDAPAAVGKPAFRDATEETGLRFIHENGARGEYLMPEIMGAGAALFDMDLDGDLDLYLVQSVGSGKLFRNELAESGKLKFTDVTATSGITYSGYGMGAATGDIDNDGELDLLITGWGSRALYRNEGGGRFSQVTLPPPPVPHQWFTSASFFDADRDGDLDLIILSYVNFTREGNKQCQAPTGEPDYCTPRAYSPVAARYYRNEGKGRYVDATAAAGIDRAQGPGLGVAAADLNGDGWPDLFVANDTAANHLWINQKNGTFREAGLQAGAAYSEDGLAKAGMGVSVGDADGDGDEDLFVVNLMREGATLYRNDGRSTDGLPVFVDATRAAGLYPITFNFTGFGAGWFDFDNDGALDLFIANGAVTLREEQRGKARPFAERNLLIRRAEKGRFTDVTDSLGGAALARAGIYRGAAFGDVDNDGDVDLVVTENGGPARVLVNEAARKGFTVELKAPVTVGAKVTVYRKGRPAMIGRMHTDSSYCSASDPRLHFGLGDGQVEKVEVMWPDGTSQVAEPGQSRSLVIQKR
jgi:hypothetical protein